MAVQNLLLPVSISNRTFRILAAGFVISFLGSLPLGTMNIAATHVSISQGTRAGWIYAIGSMLVEIIIVRITLTAMSWLLRKRRIFRLMELFTTCLLIAMAVGSFVAAYKMTGFTGSLPAFFSLHPFWTGVLLSISNPLHIPFWMGWSTVLMNKKILIASPVYYNYYISGIGAGTMLGFAVFIYGGNYMVKSITHHQTLLNMAIGSVLLLTALLQVRKMMMPPLNVSYNKSVK